MRIFFAFSPFFHTNITYQSSSTFPLRDLCCWLFAFISVTPRKVSNSIFINFNFFFFSVLPRQSTSLVSRSPHPKWPLYVVVIIGALLVDYTNATSVSNATSQTTDNATNHSSAAEYQWSIDEVGNSHFNGLKGKVFCCSSSTRLRITTTALFQECPFIAFSVPKRIKTKVAVTALVLLETTTTT